MILFVLYLVMGARIGYLVGRHAAKEGWPIWRGICTAVVITGVANLLIHGAAVFLSRAL